MSITPDEAERALEVIGRAWKQGAILRGYRRSAGYFLLWGVLWIAFYLGPYFFPHRAALIFWAGLAIGIAGSLIMMVSMKRSADGATFWRMFAIVMAINVFIAAENLILRAYGPMQGVISGLTMGLLYTVMGVWAGARILILGVALTTVTIAAYFLLPETYIVWIGLAGGGAMILTGLWLRKA
jgi:hypothetical protein